MTRRISPRVREQAALMLELSVAYPNVVTMVLFASFGIDDEAETLYWDALRAIPSGLYCSRYVEAACRVRAGWTP